MLKKHQHVDRSVFIRSVCARALLGAETQEQIAKDYGKSQAWVSRVKNGRIYYEETKDLRGKE